MSPLSGSSPLFTTRDNSQLRGASDMCRVHAGVPYYSCTCSGITSSSAPCAPAPPARPK
jgi:hypothetical protein